jgi:hypothetical protein
MNGVNAVNLHTLPGWSLENPPQYRIVMGRFAYFRTLKSSENITIAYFLFVQLIFIAFRTFLAFF